MLLNRFSWLFLVLVLSLSGIGVIRAEVHSPGSAASYEPAVLEVVKAIKGGDLQAALAIVDRHLQRFPKSRIGHLLKADILLAMARPLSGVGESIATQSEVVRGLKHQLQNRWLHATVSADRTHKGFPASLIDMGRHKHVVVADMLEGRLYLYKNNKGMPELVRDYYMSVGSAGYGKQVEGDLKTPIGVYSIYQYIDDKELPDLYGAGAFPVNYPNRMDRFRKRTGSGIWLHGTPSNTYARSPWASEGCFVLSNDDFLDIEKYIDVKQR
ncbi:MAG: L,D-transpeptidase family protein, partial [Arenicella sp.]|nr:L,D-transpeptidase family protein [Arenicella sp.]